MEQHVGAFDFREPELLRHQCDAFRCLKSPSTGNRIEQVMTTLRLLSSHFSRPAHLPSPAFMGRISKVMPELRSAIRLLPCPRLDGPFIAMLQTYLLWRRGWFVDWNGNTPLIEASGADCLGLISLSPGLGWWGLGLILVPAAAVRERQVLGA